MENNRNGSRVNATGNITKNGHSAKKPEAIHLEHVCLCPSTQVANSRAKSKE